MSKEIRIEKTAQGTIYSVGISDKFRIVQNSDNEFIIQKLFKETETKGCLWWKKTSSWDEWKRVDKNGQKYYNSIGYRIHISNYEQFKTLDEAIKWIEDYNKYPIYH